MLYGRRIVRMLRRANSFSLLLSALLPNFTRGWRSSAMSNDKLVANLVRDAQCSQRTAEVLRNVDRANFVDSSLKDLAYADRPLPIGRGDVTISAPHMHASCIELMPQIKPGAAVLDVGVGSGFLAAAFAELVGASGRVVGIDRDPALVRLAESNLRRHDAALLDSGRVRLVAADGWQGLPDDEGPWDAIHVGAAAETVPEALVRQLKPSGRMLIPVGPDGGAQSLLQLDKQADSSVQTTTLMGVRYVPLVKGLAH